MQIVVPEEVAAATVEACAQWLDRPARESEARREREDLGALAEALRFDRSAIVAEVTKPGE